MKGKIAAVLLLLAACLLLASCSAAVTENYGIRDTSISYNKAFGGDVAYHDEMAEEAPQKDDSSSIAENQDKIIRKFVLHAETKEFDSGLAAIEKRVAELGGYVESAEVSGGKSYGGGVEAKGASLIVRIPAKDADTFVSGVKTEFNVTSARETAENVSETYYDMKARAETLEIKRQALAEMLAKAEDLKDYMLINDELYSVIQEIESYQSRLKYYDNKVDYATVSIHISEVFEYTPADEPTFGERIKTAFVDGWRTFGTVCKEFSVAAVYLMPLIVAAAVIVLVIVVCTKVKSQKKARKMQNTPESSDVNAGEKH